MAGRFGALGGQDPLLCSMHMVTEVRDECEFAGSRRRSRRRDPELGLKIVSHLLALQLAQLTVHSLEQAARDQVVREA